jgi:hypothetical protein
MIRVVAERYGQFLSGPLSEGDYHDGRRLRCFAQGSG